MSDLLSEQHFGTVEKNRRSKECKELFGSSELQDFEVVEIKDEGPTMTGIRINVKFDDEGSFIPRNMWFGILYYHKSDINKTLVRGDENGVWKILPRDYGALFMNL